MNTLKRGSNQEKSEICSKCIKRIFIFHPFKTVSSRLEVVSVSFYECWRKKGKSSVRKSENQYRNISSVIFHFYKTTHSALGERTRLKWLLNVVVYISARLLLSSPLSQYTFLTSAISSYLGRPDNNIYKYY